MREIRDCTAEVFRRSEKRIKARKQKRNRVLLCGGAMLICLTVLSVSLFPALRPLEKNDGVQENMGPPAGDPETGPAPASYVRLEIQDNGQYDALIEEGTEVSRIYRRVEALLNSAAVRDEIALPESLPGAQEEDFCSATQEKQEGALGYTMTFSTAEGSTLIYCLTGNRLIDASTKQSVVLREEQLAELKEALGIPEK